METHPGEHPTEPGAEDGRSQGDAVNVSRGASRRGEGGESRGIRGEGIRANGPISLGLQFLGHEEYAGGPAKYVRSIHIQDVEDDVGTNSRDGEKESTPPRSRSSPLRRDEPHRDAPG